MHNDALILIDSMVTAAEQIEREKHGQALTTEDAWVVRAAGFLRQVAPYLFEPEPTATDYTSNVPLTAETDAQKDQS